jgi:hypothetical protein
MERTPLRIVYIAMVILTIVSMWTTYISLRDSILPEPIVSIPWDQTRVVSVSIFALGLSIAIGLMLFALKMAIIDEQKRLNIVGVIGLTIIAFISISFNMDVLYRYANEDFFISYSNSRMRSVYEDYLAQVQNTLIEKRNEFRKEVAKQEGELESEIEGLREAPAGYGPIAKEERYRLTLLEKTTQVDLETIDEALRAKEEANRLLLSSEAKTIPEIQELQDDLRVMVREAGVVGGLALPDPVNLENPLFAVFSRLFDVKTVGLMEVFILCIAFFLDLGDIIGYSLVPAARRGRRKPSPFQPYPVAEAQPDFVPENIEPIGDRLGVIPSDDNGGTPGEDKKLARIQEEPGRRPRPRPFRLRRR